MQASIVILSVNAVSPLEQPLTVPNTQRRVGVNITYPDVLFSSRWVVDEMLLVTDVSKVTEVSEELIKAKMSETVLSSRFEISRKRSTVTNRLWERHMASDRYRLCQHCLRRTKGLAECTSVHQC